MKNLLSGYDLYIGTYTQPIRFGTGQILEGKGEGIYQLSMDQSTGILKHEKLFSGIINPSYLTFDPAFQFLYTVNETKKYDDLDSGSVSAYRIEKDTGDLTLLNQRATGGTDPCHVCMNSQGTCLYVSNFMSGSVAVFKIEADGSIGAMSQFIQHEGSSVNPVRQSGPHAHSLIFSKNENLALVPDLGIDKLMIYKPDFNQGKLISANPPYLATQPGDGPRHCEFSPNGKFCYLINELQSSISAILFDERTVEMSIIQEISTIPVGCDIPNTCADIHITANGKFLYGSNRGHDSLAIYKIDPDLGHLTAQGFVSCGGKTPRNFAISPDDRYLIVACQDTDNLAVFEISEQDGSLMQVSDIEMPTPVCIKFAMK